MVGFHAKDGLCFERQDDGYVRVRKFAHRGDLAGVAEFDVTLEPNTWASLIAEMSARGEHTSEDFQRALAFHNDPPA